MSDPTSPTTWVEAVPIVGSHQLRPDPQFVDSIGRNHRLESAIADLVDNSIDAKASRILVRIVRDADRLLALCVIDDGHGIRPADMDHAMTIGARREYGPGDLGHFGIGMKAASFGQADHFAVLSKSLDGVAGRLWLKERASRDFECGVIDEAFAAAELAAAGIPTSGGTGTIVRWESVRAFPAERDGAVADRFADHTLRQLRQHLGLVFHRVIAKSGIEILLDVDDVSSDETPTVTSVTAIDPFGYLRSPVEGYPCVLRTKVGGGVALELESHIWSPRSEAEAFKLPGRPPSEFQGFYFYRNDRLLQAGGWNHAAIPSPKYQLARVAVDLDGRLVEVFLPNPEKTAITTPTGFADAIRSARSHSGIGFNDYLERAEAVYTRSKQRSRARKKVVPAGRGFAPEVRHVIGDELEYIPGEDPVDIIWENLADEQFFEIDFDSHKISLNRRYRWALVGDGGGSLNDTPLIKALLYLLSKHLFDGVFLGAKDKDDIALFQSILTTAAKLEIR